MSHDSSVFVIMNGVTYDGLEEERRYYATHVGGATVHVFRPGSRNGDSGQACRGGYVYQTRWPRVAVGLTHVCVWYFPQILALPSSSHWRDREELNSGTTRLHAK
jgi:hypothetical protein